MTWSETRRRRDLVVIPGALVAVYSLVSLFYIAFVRSAEGCAGPGWFLISGTCYRAWPLLTALAILGAGTVVAGLMLFPPNQLRVGLERLMPGSVARFGLVFMASIPSLGLVGYIVQSYRSISLDTTFIVTISGTPYNQASLLLLATLVGVGALIPYVGLYVSHGRRIASFDPQEEARVAGYPREVPPGAPVAPWPGERHDQPAEERAIARLRAHDEPAPQPLRAQVKR